MSRIAVIGTGVSGLVSAWILSQKHEVVIFEKNDYVGGHANTRVVEVGGERIPVDTGFMVFNLETYPNMVKMFDFLGVETVGTDMAFGVSSAVTGFEFYSDKVFMQKRKAFSLSYWRMLFDVVKFNREAESYAERCSENTTLGQLVTDMKMGKLFKEGYLFPMAGAIWSTEKNKIQDYPAKPFVYFFKNHGLLSPKTLNPLKTSEGRLKWYTVKGGSKAYVGEIMKRVKADLRLSCGVSQLRRTREGVEVTNQKGNLEMFDEVVCASHPDQTLNLIADCSLEEKEFLGSFSYLKNETYLHQNKSFMMKNTGFWPSWIYKEFGQNDVELSYNMNRLQNIDNKNNFFVTLNPVRKITDAYYHTTYEHPHFSLATKRAQDKAPSLQGQNKIWFAGAWLGHGFHEDGLVSALNIGEKFGITAPWEEKS